MPDRCCVSNCRSNYDGTNEYISAYQFPRNEELKDLWCRKIPRKNFTPSKRSVVCEKHFRPDMVVREDVFPTNEGKLITVSRKRPALKEAAPKFRQSSEEKKKASKERE